MFFAVIAVAIIIIAAFTVIAQYQLSDLTEDKRQKESLPILVSISADKPSGIVPLEISFTPIISNAVGLLEYYWDFGDGNTSTEISPKYTYESNGTYFCNLTVKDKNGRESTGSLTISLANNRPPTASIECSNTNPRRPFIPMLELWGQGFRMDNYAASDYRALQKSGLLKSIFRKHDSFFTVCATAIDPDGDEIVSYNWTLRPPSYTTRITKQLVEPVFHYSGQEVAIPIEDIYPASGDGYSLTLTVTDSAGQERSENIKFKVQKSTQKDQMFARQQQRNIFRTQTWNTLLAGAFAPMLKNILAQGFSSIGRFPLLKFAILYGAFNWRIVDFQDIPGWAIDIIKPILDRTGGELVDRLLVFLQEKCEVRPTFGMLVGLLLSFIDIENLGVLREMLGLDNKRPEVSNPYPNLDQKYVPIDTEKVFITVTDPEGDPFNVTISGEYVNNVTYSSVYNGSFNATLITPLPANTDITWDVLVTDGFDKEVTERYKFTTGYN